MVDAENKRRTSRREFFSLAMFAPSDKLFAFEWMQQQPSVPMDSNIMVSATPTSLNIKSFYWQISSLEQALL